LRGSAGFTPASLSSPSGEDARSEGIEKELNVGMNVMGRRGDVKSENPGDGYTPIIDVRLNFNFSVYSVIPEVSLKISFTTEVHRETQIVI